MRTVAVTGGIGSGKSYVCRIFGEKGIRVYDCDSAAKRLMRGSTQLQSMTRIPPPRTFTGKTTLSLIPSRRPSVAG